MQADIDPTAKPASVSPQSTPQSSATSSTSAPSEAVYTALSSYPFDTDTEFQAGLSSILGHPGVPSTQDEKDLKPDLVLRAQCFFYSRKFGIPTINPDGYKSWKTQFSSTSEDAGPSTNALSTAPTTTGEVDGIAPTTTVATASVGETTTEPPPYPTSFAAIVDLITNNKPIPGIQEIPDTVLQHGSSKRDTATRRRKPWEKQEAEGEQPKSSDDTSSTAIAGAISGLEINTARLNNDKTSTSLPTETTLSVSGAAAAAGAAAPGEEGEATSTHGPTTVEDEIASAINQVETQIETMERARRTGVGVMHILSPDAVPNSGLIAK